MGGKGFNQKRTHRRGAVCARGRGRWVAVFESVSAKPDSGDKFLIGFVMGCCECSVRLPDTWAGRGK